MSLAADSCCMQCYLRRNIELARKLGSEEQTTAFARKIMELMLAAPKDAPSVWYGPETADLLHEMYGLDVDRFRQEKIDSNRFVLERIPRIREKVEAAEDPVYTALQFAVLGNYLDFSALQGKVSFAALDEMLNKALDMELDRDCYAMLCRDLEKGGKLLYLTDNAGEIGFDRILAEQIHGKYPQIEITFCVRGGPALNDATREDAAAVGIPFPIIDNGNRVAGTIPDLLSAEAENALKEADMVLAKGMANVESLLGSGYNIYYAFLVKCDRFVNLFAKPMLTPMLYRETGFAVKRHPLEEM